ncbi:MAG: YaiI/YqxD family protein [Desulfuromonas sp.]|uniref:YaiI/YqxD family protein n=1 Tax=Desulfuromonas sp. TaxID=892 RepID=UPI000CB35DE7|nr:YaiI/YqxD family protein [Desulfuromonas sp.]PLX84195.1 MAG: YaiI/YqxD family protein [Desulfuromonas sp.]
MQMWVDADACPRVIKEILFRAAERLSVSLTLVANQVLRTPPSPYVRSIRVSAGLDVADLEIVRLLEPGDLVVTADIPLAAAVIEKGGHALDPRGEFFSEENIGERLTLRNFMDELRSGGVETGGPASFGRADRTAFANQLDRFLARHAPR